MVKVGFIVEGDSEKIIIESKQFKQFLGQNNCELITPVVNAKGGGNLLPQNIDVFISRLQTSNVEKIFILTDLENEASVQAVKDRINHTSVDTAFIAIKALEAWFLADTNAMQKWLKIGHSEIYPENTPDKPWDRLKEIADHLGSRGPGTKTSFAKKMIKHYDFSVITASQHPNCSSAKYLVDYFGAINAN